MLKEFGSQIKLFISLAQVIFFQTAHKREEGPATVQRQQVKCLWF